MEVNRRILALAQLPSSVYLECAASESSWAVFGG